MIGSEAIVSRTLKRVPLDFSWPQDKVWEGYVNPHSDLGWSCELCNGSGYSVSAKLFHSQWYGYVPFDAAAYGATPLALDHPAIQAFAKRNCEQSPDHYGGTGDVQVQREARRLWEMWRYQWGHNLIQADVDALMKANRLWDFTRVPRTPEQAEIVRKKVEDGGNTWLPEDNGYVPTAAEVNDWSLHGMGHDSINCAVCIEARCEREGVPLRCVQCEGSGATWESPEAKQIYEEWKEYEPPTGEGYQLWETVSEGSPQSPVFATIEELCEWCADNASTFGSFKTTAEEWRSMLDKDFVHHREGDMVFM